jgi:hypothetical protein
MTGLTKMAFKPIPIGFGPYREWREAFDNEKVYTRRDMVNALHQKDNILTAATQILGVARLLPNDDLHMMVIHRVERRDDGIYIVVK